MKSPWTSDDIKLAFDRYLLENGRLPTAPEIDRSVYLPSSRQIQRKFGGLKQLRAALGYEDIDFGSGSHRRQSTDKTNLRGWEAEKVLRDELSSMFGEPYVHTESIYGTGRNRSDFIVYTKSSIFGIDVFTTETKHDLQKNVALKIDKYEDFPKQYPLFFVAVSTNLNKAEIREAIRGMTKTSKLPNMKVVTSEELFEIVSSYVAYENPEDFVSLFSSSSSE